MFRVFSLRPEIPPIRYGSVSKLGFRALLLAFVISPVLCTLTADGRQIPFETDGEQPKPPSKQLAAAREKARAETDPATPIQDFTATAYSLRGRTASGASVRRGVIAADERVLPIGTRVRLEAGSYTGEYVVADTGGAVRGRKIEIWTPSEGEAFRFGRRAVKLTVLTRTRVRPIPAFARRELERQHSEKKITDKEYRAKAGELERYSDEFYEAVAQDVIRDERLHPNAIYSPVRYEADDPNEKDLLDTYYDRIRLEVNMARNLISKAEYDVKLREVVGEEKAIIEKGLHSPTKVAEYYDRTSQIALDMALVKQATESQWSVLSEAYKWAAIFVAMIGVILPFYISFRKEKREGRAFELQKEELRLKIAQLEQQVMPSKNNLIVS